MKLLLENLKLCWGTHDMLVPMLLGCVLGSCSLLYGVPVLRVLADQSRVILGAVGDGVLWAGVRLTLRRGGLGDGCILAALGEHVSVS